MVTKPQKNRLEAGAPVDLNVGRESSTMETLETTGEVPKSPERATEDALNAAETRVDAGIAKLQGAIDSTPDVIQAAVSRIGGSLKKDSAWSRGVDALRQQVTALKARFSARIGTLRGESALIEG